MYVAYFMLFPGRLGLWMTVSTAAADVNGKMSFEFREFLFWVVRWRGVDGKKTCFLILVIFCHVFQFGTEFDLRVRNYVMSRLLSWSLHGRSGYKARSAGHRTWPWAKPGCVRNDRCNNFFDWMELAPESVCWLVLEDRYHLFRLSSWSKAPLPHGQNHLYNFAYVVPHGSIEGLKAEWKMFITRFQYA